MSKACSMPGRKAALARSPVLHQELLDTRVAVLPRRVDRAEAPALGQVGIRAVLQRELHELVAGGLVLALGGGGRMDGSRLDVLVLRQGVHIRAPLQQQSGRVHVTEEAGQAERMKTVVTERVRACRIVVEQLAQPLRPAESRSVEDVELRISGEELLDALVLPSVQSFEQIGHQRSNRDRRLSLRTRPPV